MNDWQLEKAVSPAGLEDILRAIGAERYHDKHPFHQALHSGALDKGQVQAWALNRFLYQAGIPKKDAALMSRVDDPDLRREWRHRIMDHDGDGAGDIGGIERWLKLTDGLGLDRGIVMAGRQALPASHFAVEAYIRFVREKTLLEAVASSLTELFAPTIIAKRVEGMLASYDFVSEDTLAYFDKRLTQAPRDSGFALQYCKDHALRLDQQQAVVDALLFKTGMLWSQLDGLAFAYGLKAGERGTIPPGCFDPSQDG